MRPLEVEQLITDLRSQNGKSHVVAGPDGSLVLIQEATNEKIVFNGEEAILLLADTSAVEKLFEALDYPDEMAVELHELVIDDDVLKALEEFTTSVDEM
jgi:hypothetical protein